MKFGIITYHRADNYGAVLQSYALQEFLLDNGHDAGVIDYRNKYIENNYSVLKLHRGESFLKFLARLWFSGVIQIVKKYKLEKFRVKYLNLSKKCNKSNVSIIASDYDYIITGSDQVFAPVYSDYDQTFLLSGVCENKKKMSYAASFGVNEISDSIIEWLSDDLVNFYKISIREESGVLKLKERFEIDVTRNIDPVFLIDANKWTQFISNNLWDKYILIFTVNNSQDVIKAAQKLSKRTGLKIIYLNDKYYKKYQGVKYVVGCGIEKFLSLFYYAEYVITTSFHGTAFSIIFHKNFIVDIKLNESKGDRIIELIQRFNLNMNTCQNFLNDGNLMENDWDAVDSTIREERERSALYFNI